MAPPPRKATLSVAPGIAAFFGVVTLTLLTTFFYFVERSCHSDYHEHAPIDISMYMCCDPGYYIGLVGFGLTAAMMAASVSPVFLYLRERFAVCYNICGCPCDVALFATVGLAVAAVGLLGMAIANACEYMNTHSIAGTIFFLCGVTFAILYNAWHLCHELPCSICCCCPGDMKEGECESCCPELSGAAAGRGPTPASAYGGARLRTHPFTVGTRILLTITLAVTAVAENLLPTPHEWFVNLWVCVVGFLMQLWLVQLDLLRHARSAAQPGAADALRQPLVSSGSHRGPGAGETYGGGGGAMMDDRASDGGGEGWASDGREV